MNLQVKTILCPTDFSEPARHAFKLAGCLARDHGAQLMVVHVSAPTIMVTDGVMTLPVPVGDEYTRAGLEAQLRAWTAGQSDLDIKAVVEFGSPAELIVELAEDLHADFIVMGTHGRSGLGRLLMGSVAEHVLRRAKCPVLMVKAGVGRTSTEVEQRKAVAEV